MGGIGRGGRPRNQGMDVRVTRDHVVAFQRPDIYIVCIIQQSTLLINYDRSPLALLCFSRRMTLLFIFLINNSQPPLLIILFYFLK